MIQQFDQVIAIFHPLIVTDLKPLVVPMIGEVGVWHATWVNGEDELAPGEWAMSPVWWEEWSQKKLRAGCCWAALSELAILEVLEGHPRAVDAARRVRHWRKQMSEQIRELRERTGPTAGTKCPDEEQVAFPF